MIHQTQMDVYLCATTCTCIVGTVLYLHVHVHTYSTYMYIHIVHTCTIHIGRVHYVFIFRHFPKSQT